MSLLRKTPRPKELDVIEPKDADLENDMLFAHPHPKWGNIKNPLGLIHDEQGDPILLKGEKLIYKPTTDTFIFDVYFWSNGKVYKMLLRTGTGSVFLTNKRLLFVLKKRKFASIFNDPGNVKFTTARAWDRKNYKDSISIPLKRMVDLHNSKYMGFAMPYTDGYILQFFSKGVKFEIFLQILKNMFGDVYGKQRGQLIFFADMLKEQVKRIQEGRPSLKPITGDISDYKIDTGEIVYATKSERCPSCKYEFAYETTVPKKQKAIEISCPRCHHAYKKSTPKKAQTRRRKSP